jgi:hypothetical protein
VGQNQLVPRGTGTGTIVGTCPTLGHPTFLGKSFVPPFHPDALDLDLLAFFGGQWGVCSPRPTPKQVTADLREFFGGANDTGMSARLLWPSEAAP